MRQHLAKMVAMPYCFGCQSHDTSQPQLLEAHTLTRMENESALLLEWQQIHIQWNFAFSVHWYQLSLNNHTCVTDKSKPQLLLSFNLDPDFLLCALLSQGASLHCDFCTVSKCWTWSRIPHAVWGAFLSLCQWLLSPPLMSLLYQLGSTVLQYKLLLVEAECDVQTNLGRCYKAEQHRVNRTVKHISRKQCQNKKKYFLQAIFGWVACVCLLA